MKCHEVDYKVIGDDMQIVEIEMDPSEAVVAEAGAMNYMDFRPAAGVKPETIYP